ncbi:MAG: Gfo/Idh/MocA family oxidoreductase [Mariniblastus sp.]|nr:Gfo/Idh/MocA family oxidoreductase [Mariniblastus sp.]
MKNEATRRGFLKASATTAAIGYFGAATSRSTEGYTTGFRSVNEQPGIGFIGTGIRFHTYHGKQALKHGPCMGICDVDAIQVGRALQVAVDHHRKQKRKLAIPTHEDYRHVLDNKDVDVVIIGAVDHWHSKIVIDAMRAGKDVYCEKPVTLTIREGQQILKVQKETGRTVQVGTQQRTEFAKRFATAAAMMRENRIGDVKELNICLGGSRESAVLPVTTPPKSLNWDLWLGQCPLVDYRAESQIRDVTGWGAGYPFGRAHRYYRWFYEYSGGKLTDWGAHHVDIAMLALNKLGSDIGKITIDPQEVTHPVEFDEKGMPLSDDRFNCATQFKVKCTFEDGIDMYVRDNAPELGFDNGIMFTGKNKSRFLVNRGKIVGRPVEELKNKPLAEDSIGKLYLDDASEGDDFGNDGYHMKNFMDCVKSKKSPASDLQSHHRMLNVCHAINIAMRLNRKVVFDPSSETFGDDELANSFIEREQREGYEIIV